MDSRLARDSSTLLLHLVNAIIDGEQGKEK